jgi:hypothetical protein
VAAPTDAVRTGPTIGAITIDPTTTAGDSTSNPAVAMIVLRKIIARNEHSSTPRPTKPRSTKNVYDDLRLLYEIGIVDFDNNGDRKIPTIGPETVIIEPVSEP